MSKITDRYYSCFRKQAKDIYGDLPEVREDYYRKAICVMSKYDILGTIYEFSWCKSSQPELKSTVFLSDPRNLKVGKSMIDLPMEDIFSVLEQFRAYNMAVAYIHHCEKDKNDKIYMPTMNLVIYMDFPKDRKKRRICK